MQRWQLTLGLTVVALGAAIIAPRLAGFTLPAPRVDVPIPEVVPNVVAPIVEAVVAAPTSTGHLVVTAGLDRTAVLEGATQERFLAITVTAPDDIGESFRRAVDMAVVIDASGSMSARGKIDYAKRAAKLIASQMNSGDTYSLVTFNDDATTVVPATRVDDPTVIHRAIDRIYEGGGTNLYAGMDRGAAEVKRSLEDGAVGRVIVLSDGNANVGVTDPDSLARYAASLTGQGIAVSTIGLGLDYNEDLLARMADLSGGTYDFVDDPRELETVFADELDRTASVVARSSAVKIQLPDGVEPVEVIGWDATQTEDGWTVWMGDVYAGETRKIITKVRVTGLSDSTMDVASIKVDYQDVVDGITAAAYADATAKVTNSAATVDASVDKSRAVDANRAYGNWYLDMSTRAYERGDLAESKKLLRRGANVLNTASQQLAAPELANEAEDLDRQEVLYHSYAPASDEGKRAIKGGKELFRGRAR